MLENVLEIVDSDQSFKVVDYIQNVGREDHAPDVTQRNILLTQFTTSKIVVS